MEFVVERERWARGHNEEDNALLRPSDKKMCCLGFCALQLGATPSQIMGQNFPHIVEYGGLSPLVEYSKHTAHDSPLTLKAIEINDSESSDEEREARLSDLFAAHGHEIRFV